MLQASADGRGLLFRRKWKEKNERVSERPLLPKSRSRQTEWKAGVTGLFSIDDVQKEFLLQSLKVSECKG